MKFKELSLLDKSLIVWIFVVLIFGLYLQIAAESDGKLNHARSYNSMEKQIPLHSWVAYAFWVPIDVESYKYEAEWDPNQRVSGTDWISRIIFITLFISYWFIFMLYRGSPFGSKNKVIFLSILLSMNVWLFIETIYLLYLKVL